jgi:hypothetical protein
MLRYFDSDVTAALSLHYNLYLYLLYQRILQSTQRFYYKNDECF